MATPAISDFGSEYLKETYLKPAIAGDMVASIAVTEPGAGSDLANVQTKATLVGDEWVIDGQKVWISTAQVAEKILILARTTPLDQVTSHTDGLSLFYTDLDRSCVEVREIEKMGRKAVDSLRVEVQEFRHK